VYIVKQLRLISRIVLVFVLSLTLVPTMNASAATKGEEIVAFAKKYAGTPYSFGGTSPSGFDCSGFLYYVYGKFGIDLPRTSAEQYRVGTAVSKLELLPGDIVLFENTYKPGISHSGIYVGNNSFISAETSGIKVSSLSSSYWGPRFVKGKRVLDQTVGGSLFNDLPDNHPAFTAIKQLNQEHIIMGYNDQSYRPNEDVTRGQAAAIINRVLNHSSTGSNSFSDVGNGNAFADDISAIEKAGIIKGYTDGTFRPYDQMTRAQMAVILDRAFKLSSNADFSTASVVYNDVPSSYWAHRSIASIYHLDKTTLYQTTKFRAIDEATRAEFAAAIYNVK
jgi:peptidoglycan DL-endopeptidase CwlO